LLDGLEAVELRLSEILEDNEKFRIDSEYFQKHFLNAYTLIKSKPNKKLCEIIDVLTDFSANGSYKSIANNFTLLDYEDYAYMVRTTDLESSNYTSNVKYIDKHSYNFLEKSKIYGGEILINKIGSPGRVYHMPILNKPVSLGMNLFMLKLSKNTYFTEEFIWTYLNSKIGKLIIKRKINGTVPLTIDKISIKNLYVPELSRDFQIKIKNSVKLSHKKQEQSKTLYNQAENLLLEELGLLDYEPSKQSLSVKSFSQSFGNSGRLDSEYYLPKYDEMLSKIKSYKGGSETIELSCFLKDKNFKPNDMKPYKYVELSNIGTTGNITGCTFEIGKKLPGRARRLINKDDVIISTIEGSLQKIAIVQNEFDNSICSTGFYVINSNKINSETLLVLFKNKIMQQILKQNCSGTILTGINKDDFLKIYIPLIEQTTQLQIETKIKESFRLKKESQNLLELAKRAVEVAIEEGEDVAIELMQA